MKSLEMYPVEAARLLFGDARVDTVAPIVVSFAKTYDELCGLAEHVPEVVRWVLVEQNGVKEKNGEYDTCDVHLGEIAVEALGASVNWYLEHGTFHGAAVFVWTACLCRSRRYGWGSFEWSVKGLRDYVLITKESQMTEMLHRMTAELLAVVPWWRVFDVLRLSCLLDAIRQERNSEEALRSRLVEAPGDLTKELGLEGTQYYCKLWLSEDWKREWYDKAHMCVLSQQQIALLRQAEEYFACATDILLKGVGGQPGK